MLVIIVLSPRVTFFFRVSRYIAQLEIRKILSSLLLKHRKHVKHIP